MAKLTLFLLHLQKSLVWYTHSFDKQFLNSSWVSVTVLHSRAVAKRYALPLHSLQKMLGWMQPIWPSHIYSPYSLSIGVVFWNSILHFSVYRVTVLFIFSGTIACNSPNIPSSLHLANPWEVCVSWPLKVEWGQVTSSGQWPVNMMYFASRSKHF